MLLKEEEIKSHLRLDDGLYSDGDFLKLLAQAVQKRTETYLNRKLYAPEETILTVHGLSDTGKVLERLA